MVTIMNNNDISETPGWYLVLVARSYIMDWHCLVCLT